MNQDLLNARTQWYAAYVSGDIERLEEMESADFVVMAGHLTQDRATQLAGIASSVREGRWFPRGSYAQDERIDVHSLSADAAATYGVGRIVTPRGKAPPVVFTEIWRRTDSSWQVVHLHYHESGNGTEDA